jgi:type IV secretory pathway TraG/TraD family ATPase VirD4
MIKVIPNILNIWYNVFIDDFILLLEGDFRMKLKFRAEKKDVVAFLWACLLLLIVVAMCVVNFYHTGSTGNIPSAESFKWTFNFIKGFFPPYLGYTLLFWVVAIIALVASVSSHFFSREKGFGFTEGKKEEGFGRFAKEDEYKKFKDVEPVIINAKEAAHAGFPLVYDKKKNTVYVDNGESHSLVIGATGSGKTTMVINPLVNFLAKKGESMVITDPKGEIFEKNGEMLKDLGYDVIVVNFRDPKNGSCWNPYTLPYK